jgi:hypothetical protein
MDSVFRLIFRRFIRQFGRTLFFWVIVPIAVIILFNLLALLAAYVECQTFGSVQWGCRTPFYIQGLVCRNLTSVTTIPCINPGAKREF